VLAKLATQAAALNLQLVTCDETGDLLPDATHVQPADLAGAMDVMMALGGDGTMLHAVRILHGADIPVLGVNLGSLGFMTSVTEEALEHAVAALAAGNYTTSSRSLAHCRAYRHNECVADYIALNDIVVGWGSSSRVLRLNLHIDDDEVATYVCDGLIVSTPTGSTGHSLSAGGPIAHPLAPVFVVNVICPHTLSARPLVVGDRSTIRVTMLAMADHKNPLLSADGQGEFVLQAGDELHITKAPHSARFIHLPAYSYFSVLRQKLNWRGSSTGH
jgi:NAD+ kinase